MFKAMLRLMNIGLFFLAIFGLGLFALSHLGKTQEYAPLDHPLLKADFFLIAQGAGEGEAPANSRVGIEKTKKLSEKILIEVDLHLTKDRRWVLFSGRDLALHTNGKGLVDHTNFDELRLLDLGYQFQEGERGGHPYRGQGLRVLSLFEFLKISAPNGIVLDIHSFSPEAMDRLIEEVHNQNADQRVIIQSPRSQVIEYLREKKPFWLYGMNDPKFVQIKIMTSLFIESMVSMEADFVIASVEGSEGIYYSPRLVGELKRRHRKVIVSADTLNSVKAPWLRDHLDGVLTPIPSKAYAEIQNQK